MPSSLFSKLLLVILLFSIMMTSVCILLMRAWHHRYHEEINQIANRDTASMLGESGSFLYASTNSDAEIRQAIVTLENINSDWDIYLLDAAGYIVSASVTTSNLSLQMVNLDPVQQFLAGETDLPIYGDNPRAAGDSAVFSAARVQAAAIPAEYVYVVLGQADDASDLRAIRRSKAIDEAVGVLLFSATLGVLASIVVMRLLTRNLRRLETVMTDFHAAGFAAVPAAPTSRPTGAKDEIDRLTELFWDLAKELQSKIRALEQSDEGRREIMANVSHDLRTPIASLSAHLETLTLEPEMPAAEREEYIATCIRQCEALGRFVDQLLEAARLDAGQVTLHAEPFEIGELLHDVAQKFGLQARQAGVELFIDVSASLPLVIGDIALIERVLDNLLDNALQHTGLGDQIIVRARPCDNALQIEVSDTGVGISSGEQNRIMERFYRGDASRGGESGHAGLGLAIVSRIVELHGGDFRIESQPGNGTSCSFNLPLA